MLNFARWVFREDLCHGVPACPASRKCLRRVNNNYCGSSCERWAMGPQALVPPLGSFNWASIAGGSLSVGSPGAGYQPQGPPNLPVGGT